MTNNSKTLRDVAIEVYCVCGGRFSGSDREESDVARIEEILAQRFTMTFRREVAASVMASIYASTPGVNWQPSKFAKHAWKAADALLDTEG